MKTQAVQPFNYSRIDNNLSRSSFIRGTEPLWLKNHGVTDVINFRTLRDKGAIGEEKTALKKLGIKYHQIPSITAKPSEENIFKFLNLTNQIKQKGGKAHIHCVQGANRTGMYSFIYKMVNHIGDLHKNLAEWEKIGLDTKKYPHLMEWACDFLIKRKDIFKI